jgi:hypothetical protein
MKSKGQPIIYNGLEVKMLDKISLFNIKTTINVEFELTNSDWRQGIILETNGYFEINQQKIPNKVIIWRDTAPKEIEIKITSKDKILNVYNVWDMGDGVIHYWHNGGALYVEVVNGARIYHCNDGEPDDDFDDLVFKLKFEE